MAKKKAGKLGYAMEVAQGVSGKKEMAKPTKSRGIGRVEITRAKNGYMATCYHDTEGEPGPYKSPDKLVFKDRNSMLEGLEKYFS